MHGCGVFVVFTEEEAQPANTRDGVHAQGLFSPYPLPTAPACPASPIVSPLLSRICKSHYAYAAVADNGGGKGEIVGVSFVDVHAEGSRVATLGPVSSIAPGAGKKTFVAACAHAEKLGFSTLVRAGSGVCLSSVPGCLLAFT